MQLSHKKIRRLFKIYQRKLIILLSEYDEKRFEKF